MQIVIISGMSGAGKSHAANILEDMGYYCVDNMPVELLKGFAEFCISSSGKYEKVALVTDVRAGESFLPLFDSLSAITEMGCKSTIVFLEAELPTIIRRYKETRRPHPLMLDGESIESVIMREKDKLAPVRKRADFVIDTTGKSGNQMREILMECLGGAETARDMTVSLMSFGFKYGAPTEADMVFDVRFLPNPFYIDELRQKNGLDPEVRDYVFSNGAAVEFTERLSSLFEFLLPNFLKEGRSGVTVAIGCTGGKHRSAAIAKELSVRLDALGYRTSLIHRDIGK